MMRLQFVYIPPLTIEEEALFEGLEKMEMAIKKVNNDFKQRGI